MNKTILIAPFDGPLAAALAQAARDSGWSAALALAPRAAGRAGKDAGQDADPEAAAGAAPDPRDAEGLGNRPAGAVALPYDPASYVSAASLVTATYNALGELDAAVLVAAPFAGLAELSSCKPGELAAFVGARCSGPLYLVRELVRRFGARKSGRILLLAPERPKDSAPGPAASLAEGAFEGLGRGLFAQAEGSGWSAFGLVDASGQAERAARYALALLEDPKASKAGRWLRFTGKSGLFGSI